MLSLALGWYAGGMPAQPIRRFWEGLLEHAKLKTQLHANRGPTSERFVGASAGFKGLTFYYWVRAQSADVVFYIDCQDPERVFDALAQKRHEIEDRFGGALDWDRKDGKAHCRIQKTYDGGYQDDHRWETIFEELASAMVRLESALRPHLDSRLLAS